MGIARLHESIQPTCLNAVIVLMRAEDPGVEPAYSKDNSMQSWPLRKGDCYRW